MTHRENVLRRLGLPFDTSLSLHSLSAIFGIPLAALKAIFNRGRGAWRTNLASVRLKRTFAKNPDTDRYPRPKRLSAEQWGYARVYSFLDKGRTFYSADRDIAEALHLI